MIEYLSRHIGAKLLLSYLAIILIGVLVLVVASQFMLPSAFQRHMSGMMGNGMGMGMNMGGQEGAKGSPLYADFRASFNEALLYATLASIFIAILLSIYLSRSVVAPIQALSQASQRIADGRYEERVEARGEDELAQLATRFNQMAEKLSETESMRRQLIGDVSHELRTPLTAIKGSMEGLIDGVLPASADTFREIYAEADRLNRLVDDLQELSRVESGAYLLEMHPVDVGNLVQTVAKRMAHQAESRKIVLDVQLPPEPLHVLADEDRVLQVLTNLTANALQYTPEGGHVMVSAEKLDHEVRFSVQDSGIGIPQEAMAHVFDRFFRVDRSRSRQSGGGSGIGLTIARALVEAQGGRIWVESRGAGQGSAFHFTLPAASG